MFQLTNRPVRLANCNPRAEKHGDENVLALDIKIECLCHSHTLDVFDTALRPLLFRKPVAGEQPELALEAGDDLTELRLPKLAPLRLDEDFPGYGLSIDSGLGISEPLVLKNVTLSKFAFEPLQGGSVKITFNASCHPDTEQCGDICGLIQDDVELTLMPPAATGRIEPDPQRDIEGMLAGPEQVLIASIGTDTSGGTHLTTVVARLSDDRAITVGEFAYLPSAAEICARLLSDHGLAAQLTPVCAAEFQDMTESLLPS